MSEVAKCPACGGRMYKAFFAKKCGNCAFECELKDFTRISAAMKLAQLEVKFENCKAEDEHKYQEMIEWARNDVLKVFK